MTVVVVVVVSETCSLSRYGRIDVELRRIASIRQYLSFDATKTLISVFVFFKLDYCNFFLAGAPKHLIGKLQRVQNAAARLAVQCRRQHHITPVLYSLHRLPVLCRIQSKAVDRVNPFRGQEYKETKQQRGKQ